MPSWPRSTIAESEAGARVAFAHEVRDEVDRRKRRLGILSYDDLLGRLADALADDDAAGSASGCGSAGRIVLVDEFQDTDPKQWEVLDRAFTGHATMVLIGDPKQAIYAFRGGDVVTYLAAAATATTQATLDTNRRSDAALVERLQVVLRGAALGDERIVVRDVTASHAGSRLAGAPSSAPFRVRQVRPPRLHARPGAGPCRRRASPHRGRLRRRHRRAARLRGDLGRRADRGAPRRRARRRVVAGRAGAVGPRRARCAGGGRRRHQAADLAGRRRVADPARGPRAAAPVRPGARGRAHVVPRPHAERARPRRRGAHRRARRPAARLGAAAARARASRRSSRRPRSAA